MSVHCVVVDAWMREAQEVSMLLEDIESRIKNKDLAQEHTLKDYAQSKLLEVGVKLDRLESLLHNPPSKPILTKDDMKFRWEMLSDFQLRTRVLAVSLYTSPSSKRAGRLPVSNAKGSSKPIESENEDHVMTFLSEDDAEMLKPLISEDTTQSHIQMKHSGSCISTSMLRKVCWIICLVIGAAAFLLLLILLCAAI